MSTDGSGHQSVGAEAWRPSLWGDLLVYQDGNLKVTDLGSDDTRDHRPLGRLRHRRPHLRGLLQAEQLGLVRWWPAATEEHTSRPWTS